MTFSAELTLWIDKVKMVRTRTDLFAILDQFRILEWTDEQRSSIAKLYMRVLDNLPEEEQKAASAAGAKDVSTEGAAKIAAKAADQATKPAEQTDSSDQPATRPISQSEEDEEVWYEKM